ncbi:phosphoribosylaminoimidazole-succinocarboxamide synthase [Bacillus sp. OV322]|uniref:phosphoribosylaminoimidazolesuccinocarboxamide synthase n=1 Tax=Bacillus sp. OV322 TaxID=1882764 RepID=UPI0008F3717B|nr:phosphoribosylaminoimidazolesuccinocarboxamide synthase [Bacillus sp. OV322]SFC90228.1 phosphoribosylaminoimidazole-succinocarboxamide synthase [Bacillus sp. OV322]
MEKRELLYEGKAKRIYGTDDENIVWVSYKNSATAFNGVKKEEIEGKGRLNNEISSLIFSRLHEAGIPSHFIKKTSDSEQLVKKVAIIPLEVVVRNTAAGTLSKRLGLLEGTPLKKTLVEFYYKDDELGDPLLTEDHIRELDLASKEELLQLKEQALKVNTFLSSFFKELGVNLIDFKLEFGKTGDNEILLADEISPDTCRLWDSETNEKLDKDVFRRDLGSLTDAYEKILAKLGGRQHV